MLPAVLPTDSELPSSIILFRSFWFALCAYLLPEIQHKSENKNEGVLLTPNPTREASCGVTLPPSRRTFFVLIYLRVLCLTLCLIKPYFNATELTCILPAVLTTDSELPSSISEPFPILPFSQPTCQ